MLENIKKEGLFHHLKIYICIFNSIRKIYETLSFQKKEKYSVMEVALFQLKNDFDIHVFVI